MFALWYLSLAVDELRKRYGWTFFDIFYKTNKTDPKALDNKSATAAVPKQQEAAQSSAPKTTTTVPSVATPTPASKPETTPSPKSSSAAPKVTPVPSAKPVQDPVPVVKPTPAPKPETPPASKSTSEFEPPKPYNSPLATKTTPEIVAKPDVKQAKPSSPKKEKSFEKTINDSVDKKLMEVSKAKENGESLKNNLKNTTKDFLSGEANAYAPIKSKNSLTESN